MTMHRRIRFLGALGVCLLAATTLAPTASWAECGPYNAWATVKLDDFGTTPTTYYNCGIDLIHLSAYGLGWSAVSYGLAGLNTTQPCSEVRGKTVVWDGSGFRQGNLVSDASVADYVPSPWSTRAGGLVGSLVYAYRQGVYNREYGIGIC